MDEQYKLALDRAYVDELLMLEYALEKLSAKKDEYEGPKARHAAGAVGAAGAGAGLGAAAGELHREGLRRRLGKLKRQSTVLGAKYKNVAKGLGTPGTAAQLKKIELAQKSTKGAKELLKNRLAASGGRWKAPVAGSAALAVPAILAMGAASPKGQELISKGWSKAKKYV